MSPSDRTHSSEFDVTADVELSRDEKIRQFYDEMIRAPFIILWSDWRTRMAFIILGTYLAAGTLGVYLIDVPQPGDSARLIGAWTDWSTPLGTNRLGMGLLSLMIHATPAMFKMMATGAVFATAVGVVFGTLSGFKGGFVDRSIMTVTDIVMVIPGLPLVIILGAILEPSNPYLVGLILGVDNWPGLSRSLRAQVLAIRRENYVEASRVLGLSVPTILTRDIIPELTPLIMIRFMAANRRIIGGSVALYFLGVLPFSNLNWGVVLNRARGSMNSLDTIHWLVVPLVTLALLGFGLTLLAQGTDRVFNPRIRARHAETIKGDQADLERANKQQNASVDEGGL